jgi:hypothetical protein
LIIFLDAMREHNSYQHHQLSADMVLKLYSLNTAAVHFKYELPLYIATLHSSKTMHKLDLAIAVAAGIGMNNAFAYWAQIAIQQPLEADGFAGRVVELGAVRCARTRLQSN